MVDGIGGAAGVRGCCWWWRVCRWSEDGGRSWREIARVKGIAGGGGAWVARVAAGEINVGGEGAMG